MLKPKLLSCVNFKFLSYRIKRPPKKSKTAPTFPVSASGHEFDEKVNQAHILALKQMTDYTIEEPEETNLFQDLVISEPLEFQNKTFSQHLLDLPWKEIYQSLENMLYYGKHMTFCRLQNDSLALVSFYVHKVQRNRCISGDELVVNCSFLSEENWEKEVK